MTDERTFERVFGKSQWAVMFILARGGQGYARLRFNVGPGGAVTIPTCVDYGRPFCGSDAAIWEEEYQANVVPSPTAPVSLGELTDGGLGLDLFTEEQELWPRRSDSELDDEHDFDLERFWI